MPLDEIQKGQRDLARLQALPAPIKRALGPVKSFFSLPRDPVAAWVLEQPTSSETSYLDVLRFGACDFRRTEHAHTMTGPVGWPAEVARQLQAHNIHLAFQNLFVWHFGDFPDEATMLKRRRKHRGRPDLIVIQTGGYPAVRHVLGFNLWAFLVRESFGRRLGPVMRPIWRVMDVWLRLVGRPAPWHGPDEGLETFVAMLRQVWPGVPIEFWMQNEPVLEGFWDRTVADRLAAQTEPVLAGLDVPIISAAPIPHSMAFRGANGLDLNNRGANAVGRFYAEHLLGLAEHLAKSRAQRGASGAEPKADDH